MKGRKIRHLLGIPKAPNQRRKKNRDIYLFDKNEYIVPGPSKPTMRERRDAKLTYN